ncbi:MAG: ATP-binding protein [Pontiellaceae bacterium]|nr:ATP-binding protein [Pontiellaceae bacterium]
MEYVHRALQDLLKNRLEQFPAVLISGPRQCGKSTLARQIIQPPDAIYLDLENPADLNRLNDAESFFRENETRLICLDGIEHDPELFPVLCELCGEKSKPGRFLIVGSALPGLLRQSSVSMDGRLASLNLAPFLISELPHSGFSRHWLRGGFPESYLAASEQASQHWRRNFIQSSLERDLKLYGQALSEPAMRKLWILLARTNGQLLNTAKLAESIGISAPSVRRYIDFLESTHMLRQLHPWFANVKKQLFKSPKLLFCDTGILHTLLDINDPNELSAHPACGGSWESYAAAQLADAAGSEWNLHYYQTATGEKMDLVFHQKDRLIAVECTTSTTPRPSLGFYRSLDDLGLKQGYLVAPLEGEQEHALNNRTRIISPARLAAQL